MTGSPGPERARWWCMDKRGPLVIMIERVGPYHAARLGAIARALGQARRVVALELCRRDTTYGWDEIAVNQAQWRRKTLFDALPRPAAQVARAVWAALSEMKPGCVAIPGWGSSAAVAALVWCRLRHVPAIVMSDSTAEDAPRDAMREMVKRRLLGIAGAGLVAGSRHKAYLKALGMSETVIHTGYDVVDNDHFASGAAVARADAISLRTELGLPPRYIMSLGRFVAKKNLAALVDAHAAHLARTQASGLALVLVGDGPLKPALQAQVQALGTGEQVQFRPFTQYEDLPALYGLAEIFVLPSVVDQWGLVVNEAMAAGCPVLVSNRCGAAPDLVIEGVTGHSFDPQDRAALSAALDRLATTPEATRRMGRAAQAHIASFSLSVHADALLRAARDAGMPPLPLADKAVTA